jgi:hypothetical protein
VVQVLQKEDLAAVEPEEVVRIPETTEERIRTWH